MKFGRLKEIINIIKKTKLWVIPVVSIGLGSFGVIACSISSRFCSNVVNNWLFGFGIVFLIAIFVFAYKESGGKYYE